MSSVWMQRAMRALAVVSVAMLVACGGGSGRQCPDRHAHAHDAAAPAFVAPDWFPKGAWPTACPSWDHHRQRGAHRQPR